MRARASGRLRQIVGGYIAYRDVGRPPGLHRGLPSGSLTFIVSVGAPIEVIAHPDPRAAPAVYRSVVGGLHTSPATIRHHGDQAGVAVSLRPAGARALLGIPAAALGDTSVELTDLVGAVGEHLWERVQGLAEIADWIAVCDDVLTQLAARENGNRPAAELRRAWQLLEESGGRAGVSAIADEVGWSRQHLTRRFAAEYGLRPKQAARVLRFSRAHDALRAGGRSVSLAELAARCGYADQAHLTNEWNEMAGSSPTAWCQAEGVPFLQDGQDTRWEADAHATP